MGGSSSSKKQKDNSLVLALLLFLGAGFLVFLYFTSSPEKSQRARAAAKIKSADFEKNVNKHLMGTNQNMEMSQRRMEVENALSVSKSYQPRSAQTRYENSNHLDLGYDTAGQDTARELGRSGNQALMESPADVIQNEIYHQQISAENEEQDRVEYARQFVENARRGGWDVRLSSDLSTVISVKPIRGKNPGVPLNDISRGISSGTH